MANCPACNGNSIRSWTRPQWSEREQCMVVDPIRCDYPGCHGGQISCSDSDNDGLPKEKDDGTD